MFWAVQQTLLFPLMILSGMLLPLETGPAWMRVVSDFNPLAPRRRGRASPVRGRVPDGRCARGGAVRCGDGGRRAARRDPGDGAQRRLKHASGGAVTVDGCPRPPSASTSTCRSARRGVATATSTPTRRPSWRARALRRTGGWRRCAGSWRWPPPSSGPRAVDTVFVGGGTPSLIGATRLGAVLGGDPRDVRAGRRGRGHHRGQPRVDVARVLRRARRGRVHAGVARDAVGGAARAAGAGAPPHARPGRRRRPRGPRGRARARQPRPDLRHARGRPTPISRPRSTPSSPRGWTTSRRTR